MKKLRENNASKTEEELLKLRDDNEMLIKENISLKKEKMFLIEQINLDIILCKLIVEIINTKIIFKEFTYIIENINFKNLT